MEPIDEDDFERVLRVQRERGGPGPSSETYRARVEAVYEVLRERARDGETIPFGELADEVGTSRQYLRAVLDGVNRLELRRGDPPLSAIVVREGTGLPGEEFWNPLADHGRREPGEDRERTWRTQVERVFGRRERRRDEPTYADYRGV